MSAPIYKHVRYWVQTYGSSGQSDQIAVNTFCECETRDVIKSLQSELLNITRGNYDVEVLDKLAQAKRRIKHTSYEEWARVMLLWLAEYKG